MAWYGDWRPYVPVAERRAKAAAYATRLAKKEKRALCPVKISGRRIASSFWGQAWCDNLERYSDFANRLPRGRTYARNGSVIDLQVTRGTIKSIVSGSEVYHVEIQISVLKAALWNRVKRDCSNAIDSLLDLLQGNFDQGVMQRLTQRNEGLLPQPKEIKMRCSCPDWAGMCKHLAATLYGVGARLDMAPELLFTLRGVDHLALIRAAAETTNLDRALADQGGVPLADTDLSEVFGIEIDAGSLGNRAKSELDTSVRKKDSLPKSSNRRSKVAGPRPRERKARKVSSDEQPVTPSAKKTAKKTVKSRNGKGAATTQRIASGDGSILARKSKRPAAKKREKAR
jgi:uncharacterized Zn finger protein